MFSLRTVTFRAYVIEPDNNLLTQTLLDNQDSGHILQTQTNNLAQQQHIVQSTNTSTIVYQKKKTILEKYQDLLAKYFKEHQLNYKADDFKIVDSKSPYVELSNDVIVVKITNIIGKWKISSQIDGIKYVSSFKE